MKVGFIGNYQSGYVGEQADEVHITREIEALGHKVYRIPRDEWREYVIEGFPKGKYPNVPEDVVFDIVIICKWNHFYDGSFVQLAKQKYQCPVFYWCWDYMWDNELPAWHISMVQSADLYLGNDVRAPHYSGMKNCYYFPFDVADTDLDTWANLNEEWEDEVAFFGSCLPQGDRKEWLEIINKEFPVKIYSWNDREWRDLGFDASPALYGADFNRKVAHTRICLGFSVYPSSWGYWSNRTGKTLLAGGFLLQQYAPGMELFFGDSIAYFSTPEEAIEKIRYYLSNPKETEEIRKRGNVLGKHKFSSRARVKELMILAERFIKEDKTKWQL